VANGKTPEAPTQQSLDFGDRGEAPRDAVFRHNVVSFKRPTRPLPRQDPEAAAAEKLILEKASRLCW